MNNCGLLLFSRFGHHVTYLWGPGIYVYIVNRFMQYVLHQSSDLRACCFSAASVSRVGLLRLRMFLQFLWCLKLAQRRSCLYTLGLAVGPKVATFIYLELSQEVVFLRGSGPP